MAGLIAAALAAIQPESDSTARISPGKLSTRTRRSDELGNGPFSRRNLVDNFPPRLKLSELSRHKNHI